MGSIQKFLAVYAQACPALCDSMDYSPPVSSAHGILQARILKWVPFPSPGDLPNPEIEPRSPTLQADSLPAEPQEKPRNTGMGNLPFPVDLPVPGIELGSPALIELSGKP